MHSKPSGKLNGVVLEPILHNQHEANKLLLMPLYPVRWSGCTFLLHKDQILEFCNAINQGPQPGKLMNADYYAQGEYWPEKLGGLATLPGEWNTYLLKRPVVATIMQVREDDSAWIDRGSEDGIRKGMHLKAHGRKGDRYPYREVEVVAVDAHSSVIRQVDNECAYRQQLPDFGDGALISGEKVTSRFREDADSTSDSSGAENP